jgi:hypothetical protein
MTPKQTLIMWCLLGRQGQAMQGDIVPKVEKKDREALVAAGYVSSGKYSRGAIGLKLEDKGWRRAGEHLGDELPKNYQVLRQWLTMLQRHLDQSGETLAEFIGPASEWPPSPPPAKVRKSKKAKTAPVVKPPPSPADLRARIETAYLGYRGAKNRRRAGQGPDAQPHAEDVAAPGCIPGAVPAALQRHQQRRPGA